MTEWLWNPSAYVIITIPAIANIAATIWLETKKESKRYWTTPSMEKHESSFKREVGPSASSAHVENEEEAQAGTPEPMPHPWLQRSCGQSREGAAASGLGRS